MAHSPLLVAHSGNLSPFFRTCLETAGFILIDATQAPASGALAALLVVYEEIEAYRKHPVPALTPAILVAERIDNATVAAAAAIGALDVVLSGDQMHLLAAIGRAINVHRADGALSPGEESAITRKILDLTPNLVSVRDASGRLLAVSQSFADFFATTVEEMIGKTFDGFLSPEELARETAEDREVLQSKRSKVIERDVVDRSGARRRLQVVKRPLVVTPSGPLVLSVAGDITRRHRTETTLANTNDFLKSVLETISDAVFTLDLSGKFTLINGRLIDLTGFAQHELLGMSFTKTYIPHISSGI